MPTRFRNRQACHRPVTSARLSVEPLEARFLMSGNPTPIVAAPVLEITSGNTLDLTHPVQVSGTIGSGPAGTADVNWYNFTLARPTQVVLSAAPQGGQADPVLSLYNNDPNDFNDLYDPLGHRLLAQAQGNPGGPTTLTESLAPGTYFVAVSGAGNSTFHPLLAGSGYPGIPGAYTLRLTSTDLGLTAANGPVVLTTSPGTGQALSGSPLVIRLDLSASIDPNSAIAGQTVRLTFNPTGAFGNGNDQDVPLAGISYSDQIAELQLTPAASLAPGFYRVFLAGNQGGGGSVLTDPTDQIPLGENASHRNGQDYTVTFQVAGIDGVPGAVRSDDSPATAHVLGNITGAGLVQATGTIGADPAYNFASSNQFLSNPAAQVDLYHFQVSGPGRYSLTAEVFAGRIGSPLDPALSLFRVDTTTHQLVEVAANDNTLDSAMAADGTQPLFNDAALFAGLTAGDYYIAVSGSSNLPLTDPTLGALPGTNGIFDPNVAHSGFNGFTTGPYVLNLDVEAVVTAPQVTAVSFQMGTDPNAPAFPLLAGVGLPLPPTFFDVQFSEPVNLQQLLYQTVQQNPTATGLDAVFVTVPTTRNGPATVLHPRLLSYNPDTGVAQFVMLDAVANGPYLNGQTPALHLSGVGPLGLTDMGGNPLAGNSASGDYVVPFRVYGPSRGTAGNSLLWTSTEPNNTQTSAQSLGVLFANELRSKVVVQRTANPTAADQSDYYSFQVLQSRDYLFNLQSTTLPAYTPATATRTAQPLALWSQSLGRWLTGVQLGSSGRAFQFTLTAGQYVVKVGGWTTSQAPGVNYKLSIGLSNSLDNPPPLTVGPLPAIRVRLAETAPTPPVTPESPASASTSLANGAGLLASASPFTPSVALAAPSSGLIPDRVIVAAAPAAAPVTGTNAAVSILLPRVGVQVGVRGEEATAETAGPGAHGDATSPIPIASLFLVNSLFVSADGLAGVQDLPKPVSGPEQGPVKAGPESIPPAVVEMPAPDATVKGMPAKALEVVFAMGSLRSGLSGSFWAPGQLPDELSGEALAGFTASPTDKTATRKRWLDAFVLVSVGASLTLGGWCSVRLRRRRPADRPMRICWGGEDSTDFPE